MLEITNRTLKWNEARQINASEVCEKDQQPALSDWVMERLEVFEKEPLYTKTGIEVGVKLK